jgi:hypothetical protein
MAASARAGAAGHPGNPTDLQRTAPHPLSVAPRQTSGPQPKSRPERRAARRRRPEPAVSDPLRCAPERLRRSRQSRLTPLDDWTLEIIGFVRSASAHRV